MHLITYDCLVQRVMVVLLSNTIIEINIYVFKMVITCLVKVRILSEFVDVLFYSKFKLDALI